MDPVAHTLTGAALAAAGLRRVTPLATAALLLGANAPDIDAVLMFGGDYVSVAHRRGWTHGLPALIVLPFLLTGLLLAWDRHVRSRKRPGATPARAGPLLALSALAVVTHPVLDWMNNYGMRWLMPFDGSWSYGDALFIIDPWLWLVLGGVAFLTWSRRPAALVAWIAFWALASVLVLTSPMVPMPARWLWIAGLALLAIARWKAPGAPRQIEQQRPIEQPREIDRPLNMEQPRLERTATIALVLITVYMGINAAANVPARAAVRAAMAEQGHGPVTDVMVAPSPANPFAGPVVVQTADAYHLGDWHWLRTPRFERDERIIPRPSPDDPVYRAAADTLLARRFLTWSRYPFIETQRDGDDDDDGYVVRFRDARYLDRLGPGAGPTVTLDRERRPTGARADDDGSE